MFNEKRFRLKVHQYGPGGAGEGGGGSPGGPGGPGGTGPGGPGPGGGPSGIGMGGAFGSGFGGLGLGDADAFGGAFGGPFGGGFSPMGLDFSRGLMSLGLPAPTSTDPVTVNSLISLALPFPFNAIHAAFSSFDKGFANFSQPAPGDPGPTGGPGGYNSPVSQTTKVITKAVAPPAPVAPPPSPSLEADRRRKRVGRQETILTSRSALSEAPTYSPTLLGQ